MTTWLKMQVQDTLPVFALMRSFYDRRLGSGKVPDARLMDAIQRCCGDYPYLEGWVICEDSAPVGYAMLNRGYDPAEGLEHVILQELYISPECRSRGTGDRFLRALPDLYPGCGHVFAPDSAPDSTWRPLGYQRTATLFGAPCPPAKAAPAAPQEAQRKGRKSRESASPGYQQLSIGTV